MEFRTHDFLVRATCQPLSYARLIININNICIKWWSILVRKEHEILRVTLPEKIIKKKNSFKPWKSKFIKFEKKNQHLWNIIIAKLSWDNFP